MTTYAEVLDRLTRVFRAFFGDEQIKLAPSMTAQDVDGWDSVSTVQLMIAIECEFKIRFRTGDVASLENVGQLCARIAEKLGG